MGVTHVTVVIRNPADPEKTWEGLFLVEHIWRAEMVNNLLTMLSERRTLKP